VSARPLTLRIQPLRSPAIRPAAQRTRSAGEQRGIEAPFGRSVSSVAAIVTSIATKGGVQSDTTRSGPRPIPSILSCSLRHEVAVSTVILYHLFYTNFHPSGASSPGPMQQFGLLRLRAGIMLICRSRLIGVARGAWSPSAVGVIGASTVVIVRFVNPLLDVLWPINA
jgi:hypothetical protein